VQTSWTFFLLFALRGSVYFTCAPGCLFSIYVASLFDGGTAMRAVCQFRPSSEWCLCVYERANANENGLRAETWKIDRGCCVELEFACSVIGVFFFTLQFESKSRYGVAVIRFI
jgi:hypothetical protein